MRVASLLVPLLLLAAPVVAAQGAAVPITVRNGDIVGADPVVAPGASVTFAVKNEDAESHTFIIIVADAACGPAGRKLADARLRGGGHVTNVPYSHPTGDDPAPSIIIDGDTVAFIDSPASGNSGSVSTACAKPPAQKSFLPLPASLALAGLLAAVALLRRR